MQSPINWESIQTDGALLLLLLTQLLPQAEIARNAGRAIRSDDRNKSHDISAFLYSAGSVASFLWPGPNRRSELKMAFPHRGNDLRLLLLQPSNELEGLKSIRNDLAHIDERIEQIFLESTLPKFSAWGSGSPQPGRADLMNYDASTGSIHSTGGKIVLADLAEWLEFLIQRGGIVFPRLLLSAHEIPLER